MTQSARAIDRKAAIAAYKERKTPAGVFVVRCTPTGQAWVGASRHLDTQQNGLWFALRQGGARNRDLQAAWTAHGEAAFSYEALERLPDDTSAYLLPSLLKERSRDWLARLDALGI